MKFPRVRLGAKVIYHDDERFLAFLFIKEKPLHPVGATALEKLEDKAGRAVQEKGIAFVFRRAVEKGKRAVFRRDFLDGKGAHGGI